MKKKSKNEEYFHSFHLFSTKFFEFHKAAAAKIFHSNPEQFA